MVLTSVYVCVHGITTKGSYKHLCFVAVATYTVSKILYSNYLGVNMGSHYISEVIEVFPRWNGQQNVIIDFLFPFPLVLA